MNITINGKSISIKGNCSSIITKNGKIIIDGKEIENAKDVIDIHVDGNVGSIKCDGSVDVTGYVDKEINCGGSVSCEDVNGPIDAGGSVRCGSVGGSVDAGGSIKMTK